MDYLSKFRAFQLDSPGSLFSFYKPGEYTLIEARLPKGGLELLLDDLSFHGKERIDSLHITSWDSDHCTYDDLVQIINHLRPERIEIPEYLPTSNDGQLCRSLITKYDDIHQKYVQNVHIISQDYLSKLQPAAKGAINNVLHPSIYNCNNKNDMSLIKLFRSAGFNVFSLGDCESAQLSATISANSFFTSEVDVLILAHHGADNGFTTAELLDTLKPKLAVCSSNYDNQYDHPSPEIRKLLAQRNIPLMTTKRGDVIIYQPDGYDYATAVNLISDNEIEESRVGFNPKRLIAASNAA